MTIPLWGYHKTPYQNVIWPSIELSWKFQISIFFGLSPNAHRLPLRFQHLVQTWKITFAQHGEHALIKWHIFLLKVRQFATPMTSCKHWLSPVYSCIYCVRQTCDTYEVRPYSVDFKAPGGLLNPLSKTVRSHCKFNWIKGPVIFWNDRKAQRSLARGIWRYFPYFLPWNYML